jgi:hypothetical protein
MARPGDLWKNLLAVVRTRRARNTAAALGVAAVMAGLLSFHTGGSVADAAGWLAATWAGLSVVIGPQWVRNDLRSDLLKLDLLRSYPLAGRAVLAAETAASTAVLTALQLGLLLVAYFAFLGNTHMYPPLGLRTLALATAAACLPGINYLGLLIQNGAALLFPAWIHLGSGRPGGVEALGQNMLIIVAYSALLGAGLALPRDAGAARVRAVAGWRGLVGDHPRRRRVARRPRRRGRGAAALARGRVRIDGPGGSGDRGLAGSHAARGVLSEES